MADFQYNLMIIQKWVTYFLLGHHFRNVAIFKQQPVENPEVLWRQVGVASLLTNGERFFILMRRFAVLTVWCEY